jgi:hypothetical protein
MLSTSAHIDSSDIGGQLAEKVFQHGNSNWHFGSKAKHLLARVDLGLLSFERGEWANQEQASEVIAGPRWRTAAFDDR